jgi:hypothetical protein
MKSDIAISAFVEAGRLDLSSNISSNLGTTIVIITNITHTTTNIIKEGYISAPLSFPLIDSTFSI